jgi:hypothetical protein
MDRQEFTQQFAQNAMKQLGIKEEEVALFTFIPEPDWDRNETQMIKNTVRRHLGVGAVTSLEEAMQREKRHPDAVRGIFFLKNGESLIAEEVMPLWA